MNLPRLRTLSIERATEAVRDSTSAIILSRTLFTTCLLDADATSAAGRFLLSPTFTATSHLLQCFRSTMQICNPWRLLRGQTLSAIPTQVFVQTGLEWELRRAGLILVRLRYPRPVSLVMLDEISYGVPGSRS